MIYGEELILDIHDCDVKKFTKYYINKFFKGLCKEIDMEPYKVTFWEYATQEEFDAAPPHLKGVSAVQFIGTSNITIHTLYDLKAVYLNIFSCKEFHYMAAHKFCEKFFEGKVINSKTLNRL